MVEGTRLLIRYGRFSEISSSQKTSENQGIFAQGHHLRSPEFRSSWTLLDTSRQKLLSQICENLLRKIAMRKQIAFNE